MKKLVAVMIGTAGLLSGCVAYDTPYGDNRPGYYSDGRSYQGSDGRYYQSADGRYYQGNPNDRDGDGVRNSRDRRPDNPYRY